MKKIALGIEYHGTAFTGWQRQPGKRTVQGCLEDVLSRVADHPVEVVCAGRTDRGVHALNQVVHFTTSAERTVRGWILGCNTQLSSDMNVIWSCEVSDDFHARHRALTRTYQYWIYNHWIRSSVLHQRVAWYCKTLDAGRMHQAAQYLVGKHDFSSFRASHCQANTPVRNMHAISVERSGQLLKIEVTANAFLYHMVRNIVGSLVRVGLGDKAPEWIKNVLEQLDRRQAGSTAPAEGLYFSHVSYDPAFNLPFEPRLNLENLLKSLSTEKA